MKFKFLKSEKSQVWVETVVYTLIGLAIIGTIIGITTPKIKQMTDRAIIEQTITALNELNDRVYKVQSSFGSSREISVRIKKGSLIIDAEQNRISYVMENTGLKFSQPGDEIKQGELTLLTEENGKNYNINIILKYSSDITYDGLNDKKIFTQAPTAYNLLIENKEGGKIDITSI